MPSSPGENLGEVWEFSSRWNASRVFTVLLSNSPKRFTHFSPGYEGTENAFYFFCKIIILRFNKEKDCIQSAYDVYLNFFHETITSHDLETEPTILLTTFSCFIATWKHTCTPIKTHVLSKLFYNILNNKSFTFKFCRMFLKVISCGPR